MLSTYSGFISGRLFVGPDFIHLDPERRCKVSEAEGTHLANMQHPDIPDGNPTGWLFAAIQEVLEPKDQEAVNNREG